MEGHRNPILGDAGEGLFQYLASYRWGAKVLRHPEAPRTDAMLLWPDFPEAGWLPVQVKSVERITRNTIRLRPSEIAGWHLLKPILALCERATARGWWIETDQHRVPYRPLRPMSFSIGGRRLIDETTKPLIRQIAYRRANREMLSAKPRIPQPMRRLTADRLMGLIRVTNQEINRSKDLDRDVAALALARIIHHARGTLTDVELIPVLEELLDRASSRRMGGRSHTLGGIISLVFTHEKWRSVPSLTDQLQRTAEFAVLSGDFAHAEFGLLMAARAAELQRRPHRDHIEELISRAPDSSKTPWFRDVAQRLGRWHPTRRPIRQVFPGRRLMLDVVRPSDPGLGILERQREAQQVVDRIILKGSTGVSDEEFGLVDQLTRFRADQVLWYEMGRTLS